MWEIHETIGFAILGLGAVLMIWSFLKREGSPKAAKTFLGLLGITILLIFQNGDLGAGMISVEGAAVKAMQRKPEATPPQGEGSVPESKDDSHDHHGQDHHH